MKTYFLLIVYLLSAVTQAQHTDSHNSVDYEALNRAELEIALKDTTVDSFYKTIYNEGRLVDLSSEKLLLSLADSLLFIKDTRLDLFYFLCFTKSMNGADGYYSEALGMNAFKFISDRTPAFIDYFTIGVRLSEKDLNNWARCLFMEFQIDREKEEIKAINELELFIQSKYPQNAIAINLIKKIRMEAEMLGFGK